MAIGAAINTRILGGAYDYACHTVAVDQSPECDALDVTVMCSQGWREFIAGLKKGPITVSGYQDFAAGEVDSIVSTPQVAPWTIGPVGADDGMVSYLTQGLQYKYTPLGGKIGDPAPFSLGIMGVAPLVRGQIMHPHVAGTTAVTRNASGNGTIVQLGAVPAAPRRMWATLHVLSLTGTTPSLIVKVQSAATSGFASPTDRIIFATATGATSEWASATGAIADTWWRVVYTIAGGTPLTQFAVACGIA